MQNACHPTNTVMRYTSRDLRHQNNGKPDAFDFNADWLQNLRENLLSATEPNMTIGKGPPTDSQWRESMQLEQPRAPLADLWVDSTYGIPRRALRLRYTGSEHNTSSYPSDHHRFLEERRNVVRQAPRHVAGAHRHPTQNWARR